MDGHSPYYTQPLLGDPNPNPTSAGSENHVEGSQPPVKRKRGRPRKYGPDGSMPLALSPLSPESGPAVGSGSGLDGQKRGRPPGTGRKLHLASLGEWVLGSAGVGFTPHVIIIPEGVGRFEILCLSGSYFLTDDGGSHRRSGGLSISLSSPDGRIFGGSISGVLVAASPVQIIVGSFIYGGSKGKHRTKTGEEKDVSSEPQKDDHPIIAPRNQSSTASPTPMMGRWPDFREIDLRG